MAMVGADADRLTAAAAQMRTSADELDLHSKSINQTLGGVSWIGQVATAFVNMWNSGQRAQLHSTANFIRDAATKLDGHAQQQRDASAASGGAASGGAASDFRQPPSTGDQTSPGALPTQAPPAHIGPDSNAAGATAGSLPNSSRTWQEAQAAYKLQYDTHPLWRDGSPTGANSYQCVSWAWARIRELGGTDQQIQGNGDTMAGNMGGTSTTVPELGAVISSPTGHVMIAEEISRTADGRLRVRVSEMNTFGNEHWSNAKPEEFKSDRWIEQSTSGDWTYYNTTRKLVVFNPNYPT